MTQYRIGKTNKSSHTDIVIKPKKSVFRARYLPLIAPPRTPETLHVRIYHNKPDVVHFTYIDATGYRYDNLMVNKSEVTDPAVLAAIKSIQAIGNLPQHDSTPFLEETSNRLKA